MAGDADEELLARLGVVAANPTEYERVLLAQVEEQTKETAAEELGEQGGEDVEAAQDFLRDNDPEFSEVRAGTSRIRSVLGTLEKEIAAVSAARETFNLPESGVVKADAVETTAKKRKKKGAPISPKDGGETMHLALLDERLESLKRRRKNLITKLKVLVKFKIPQENGAKLSQPGIQKGQGSSSGIRRGKEQDAPKSQAISFVEDDDFDAALDAASGSVETEREKLIRKGVITPFSKVGGFERRVRSRPAERPSANEEAEDGLVRRSIANAAASMSAINKARPTTMLLDSSELPKQECPTHEFRHLRTPFKRVTADEGDEKPVKIRAQPRSKRKRPQADKKWRRRVDVSSDSESDSLEDANAAANMFASDDDASARHSQAKRRLRLASKSNEGADNGSVKGTLEGENLKDDEENEPEEVMDVVLEGGLKIPGAIYGKLFAYQQTGVKWMWELHCQKSGGIIGDEMGLGKTIQVISFLAALHYSGLYSPSIVICPVTLLRQWKREVKKWYPSFKAVIVHDSALKGGRVKKFNKKKAGTSEEAKSSETEKVDGNDSESEEDMKPKKANRWDAMIKSVVESESGLLITTYEQLRLHRKKLLDVNWGYAVLDEGHRIRNPDAEVTLVCKQLQTVHRVIMTGAPIQNRLTELWSLFDFVFPGKLGVLPVFHAQFGLPIQIGGYANATPLQVSTAYKCAVVLRDLILPYLLRRMKVDVDANLTKKTEHVLFCSLLPEQRAAYRAFLGSSEVEQIMEGSRNSLYGIDILRKICNHPDLLEREHGAGNPDYGNPERSGKLKLVMQILNLWKSQGHRVLMFAQTQQMLDILQNFAESQNYEHRRMDGSTAVKHRMALIDEFNESEHVFLFILTTKVGGLGTNLIGANRVIIFDPDWNPSTDMQARERAWRIGQKKDVTIYRLITRGTIEEKVYHRQIYKHFLTNKILKDPHQRRIFKARDMRDLFTLQEDTHGIAKTETANLFGDVADMLSGDKDIQAGKQIILSEINNSRKKSRGRNSVMVENQIPSHKTDLKGKDSLENGDEDTHEDESRILKNLFEANGIHSAMDHDAILAVSEKEKVLVDHEAGRVAQRAADELRRSRMLRASDNIAVPTWTGRSGEAGAPNSLRRRFGSTTNTRLVSSSAVQATTVSNVQSRSVQEVRGDLSSNARQLAGFGAGSAAGKALSSSDVLSRMRERRMGAVGAGMESLGPSSSANIVLKSSPVASQAMLDSQSSLQGSQVSFAEPGVQYRRFGRGRRAVSTPAGGGSQGTAPESGRGTGLVTSFFLGTSSEALSAQSGGLTNRLGRGSPITPPGLGQDSHSSASSSSNGRSLSNSALSSDASQVRAGQSEGLLAEIRAFLRQNGGSVPSVPIVEHFRTRVSSRERSLFRQLLTEAATLQKGVGETGKWVLNSTSNGTS